MCRCGCGQNMRWIEARVSGRACYIASFIPALNQIERCMAKAGENSLVAHDVISYGHDIYTKGKTASQRGGWDRNGTE